MSHPKKESAAATRSLPRRRRGARAAEASAGIDFCEGMLINLISEASLIFPQAPAVVYPRPRRTGAAE